MRLIDLRPGMQRVDTTAKIEYIDPPRDVQTKYGPGQVAEASVIDDTGSIRLVLWNEQISLVSKGQTVSIQNGFVDSFRGELRLNVGRYGRITVVVQAQPEGNTASGQPISGGTRNSLFPDMTPQRPKCPKCGDAYVCMNCDP